MGVNDKADRINKELLKQIKLLRESANASSSALDSLKEALGIQQRRSTAESDLLKTSNEINRAIQNQQVGLEDISSIQREIAKNQKLINKGKLTEQGLEESIGEKGNKRAQTAIGLHKHYSKVRDLIKEQTDALAKGEKIDVGKLNKLKESEKLIANALDGVISQLSPLEQQTVAIKVQNDELDKQNKLRQKELEKEKEIEKKTGIIGGLLKGISKIPILGDVFDAEKAMGKMKDHLREGGSIIGALGKGLKNIGSQMITGILNPANLIVGAFTMMISIFKDLDSGAGDYAKNMNVTYGEALATRKEMSDLALSTGNAAVNSQRLMESQMAVSQAIGTNAKLNKADLVTMTEMVRMAGMTHGEMIGIQKISLVNGKSLKENTRDILGAANAQASKNGLVVNEKEILKEVSKASAALTLSLGNNPKELAKAVVQAKQFGLTLEQADKIANSLLDFESSIENELSAELLTGKELNFEKARQLALNNDIAGAAEEVAKQVGTSADFAKMNRIQQEAIAKAAGLSREELAKSLMDKEALAKMSGIEGKSAQEKYNNLRKTMSAEEAAKKLGDDKMAAMYEQQSVQEKFDDQMAQLKEMLANQLLPIFMKIAEVLQNNMGIIKFTVKWALRLGAAYLAIKGTMFAINKLAKIGEGIDKAKEMYSKGLLSTLGLQASAEAYKNTMAQTGNVAAATRAAMEQTILGHMISQGVRFVYNIGQQAILLGQKAVEVAANGTILSSLAAMGAGIVKNIAKGAVWLAQLLASAAAAMSANAAITFGVGVAIAVAAAVAGYAAVKAMTANDMFSPGQGGGGYGKRTLLAPEGAIQLNNNDTVIAGTNLFGDDTVSEPGKATKTAGEGKLKVKGGGDMSAVISAINSLASRPINVQIDGKKVITATTEQNPNASGDAANTNSYKVQ